MSEPFDVAYLDEKINQVERTWEGVDTQAFLNEVRGQEDDESELPEGWVETKLSVLTTKIGSGSTPRGGNDNYKSAGVPLIRSMNVVFFGFKRDGIVYLDDEQAAALQGATVRGGDILLNITGASIGRVTIAPPDMEGARVNQHVCIVRLHTVVFPKYLNGFLSSPQVQALVNSDNYGVTRQALTKEQVSQFSIPLPPLPEQKRIVAKLDTLLGRLGECQSRMNRVPALLKRFRQSVLAAATCGRLTEDWREDNPLSAGFAEEALTTAERSKNTKRRGKSAALPTDREDLFEIPESWSWVENGRLSADIPGAICAGPFGTIFKAKDFRPSGVPIVFLRHVGMMSYITAKPQFMDQRVWKELHQQYSVFGGELLVAKLGDPPGTACIYPDGIGTAMVTPDVMKMTVDSSVASTKYLMYFFNSSGAKAIVESLCFGVTRLRIDLALFREFPIPLPPLAEQLEIVRRVESLLALADRIEARYLAAKAKVDRLQPALLAKAFRGELVAQDPNDEPASVLLERVKATSEAERSPSRRGRPRK